jgi:hypothetical protein
MIFKNPYTNQYVAPYGYCFYNHEGEKLGRVIWVTNVEGIYLDQCFEEWGIRE